MMLQLIGWTLIHSVWEGGAIAVALALAFALTRRSPASLRYALGMIGLTLMIAVPIATAMRTSTAPVKETITPDATETPQPAISLRSNASPSSRPSVPPFAGKVISTAHNQAASLPASLLDKLEPSLPWLVTAWLIGLVLLSTRMIYGVAQTRRIVRDANGSSKELRELVARLADRLGIRRHIRIFEGAHVSVPMVIGWIRPAIIAPASLVTGLAPWQVEMLLAHELAHIRRYDFLANMLQTVLETLLFFHPAAWWLSERIREERENCCDDIAVAICGGDRKGYTATLLALEESRGRRQVFAAAADGNSDRGTLLRRAMRLMTGGPAHLDLGARWVAGVITILAALFTTGPAVGRAAGLPTPTLDVRALLLPEPQSAQTSHVLLTKPDSVVRYVGTARFADRWDWAQQRGRLMGSRRYWIGYLIAGDPSPMNMVYLDRETPVRSGTSTFMGRMRFGDAGNLIFTGAALAPLVGNHSPRSVAIFLQFDRSSGSDRVTRVHVGSFGLPVSFGDAPAIWIDSATDNESIAKLRALFANQPSLEVQKDLVSAVGMHRDANVMLPTLAAWVDSPDQSETIRREAIGVIADIQDPRALALMSRVARSDRSQRVSQEAIESFEQFRFPAATDSLMSFATSLENSRLRQAALETLGEREEPRVAVFLKKLATSTSDDHLRREALDALSTHGDGFAELSDLALNGDAELRAIAIEQLGDNEHSDRSVPLLLQIVRADPDESVKRKAVEALGNVSDKRGYEALRSIALGNQSERLRREALEAYVQDADSRAAVEFLKTIITKDPSARMKLDALEMLPDVHNGDGIAAVREIAQSSADPRVRRRAMEILAEER